MSIFIVKVSLNNWNKSALKNTFMFFASRAPSSHVAIPSWHNFSRNWF